MFYCILYIQTYGAILDITFLFGLKRSLNIYEQAGAELCQAQDKLCWAVLLLVKYVNFDPAKMAKIVFFCWQIFVPLQKYFDQKQ